jgi:hypothetical protein
LIGQWKDPKQKEGANNVLISLKSARRKDDYFMGVLENAGHLNEFGWWDPSQMGIRGHALQYFYPKVCIFYFNIPMDVP